MEFRRVLFRSCFCRGGCSKAVDAKTQTIQTCIAFPAESRPRLNGYFERIGGKQVGFVSSLLRIEKRPARHGHHIRANPLRFQGGSEEHTSELQSLMRISYAVFCLKKKNNTSKSLIHTIIN